MSTLKVDAIGKFDTTANAITFDSNNNASFTGSVNATNPMMNKNLSINGGMNVWQRSTSASVTTTGYYTADRWRTATNLGTFTQSRSTDVPASQGFGYSLKMDCTTADASPTSNKLLILQQKIEGQNLQHLLKGTSSAKALTLSFWVKSNKTGTYVIEIDHETASRSISKSYTISSANTWEKKEITFDGDTSSTIANDNAIGLSILWWLGAGSDFSSGSLGTSWASTTDANRAVGQVNLADSTSNEWYVTGCQLEVGSTASGFEFEPFATTLRKCRRYYVRWDRTGPPAVPYVHAVYLGIAQFFSTTQAVLLFTYIQEPMRDTPDLEYSNAIHVTVIENGNVSEGSTALAMFNDTLHSDETLSMNPVLVMTTSGATNARVGRSFLNDVIAWLAFDAEL